MKKIIIMLIATLLLGSGCNFSSDKLNNPTIYSTTYPITFMIDYMYGDYSTINSIYPKDTDISEYELTSKQIQEYAKNDLFIYNGLNNEKNIAKNFVDENNDIFLIDATYSLAIYHSEEEIWLSPNNALMIAKNIHDNLNIYIDNIEILESIKNNYNNLSEILSVMDADLRQIGNTAINQNNNTLVVSSDAYLYLEDYGFNVISLENDSNLNEETLTSIKNNFKNNNYLGLINEYGDLNDIVNDLIDNYEAAEISTTTLYSEPESIDYLSSMQEFISNLEALVNN